MGLFRRRRRGSNEPDAPSPREAQRATREYLAEFVRTRVGVEAYVEPETNVTQTTVVLIATTGEWTRRKVPDAATARKIAEELGIPVYDVQRTGYPPRMREWNARQRRGRTE
ncbi:MAG: oxidoreductase [Actinomycetales bacterium]|nr:oxidoreductase [Actinomycetales bacterium]